jgi:hypothetical protein
MQNALQTNRTGPATQFGHRQRPVARASCRVPAPSAVLRLRAGGTGRAVVYRRPQHLERAGHRPGGSVVGARSTAAKATCSQPTGPLVLLRLRLDTRHVCPRLFPADRVARCSSLCLHWRRSQYLLRAWEMLFNPGRRHTTGHLGRVRSRTKKKLTRAGRAVLRCRHWHRLRFRRRSERPRAVTPLAARAAMAGAGE